MDSIQPVSNATTGSAAAGRPLATSETAGVGAAQPAAAPQTATSVSATSSVTNISVVYSRVDSMLDSLGLDQQANQVLRMILALLIMEALLGQDGGSRQSGGVGLSATDILAHHGMRSENMGIQAETNMIQIQQQSTTLTTSQAVQSLTDANEQGDAEGTTLDTRA